MTTTTTTDIHDADYRWVPTLGFGAHLRQLLTATGLPWRVLALAAGVSPLTVERLLGAGRPLSRIRARDARRLLRLDPRSLRALEQCQVSARGTATRVAALLTAGVPEARLAAELGIGRDEMIALATGRARQCSEMVRLRTRAACQSHRLWTCMDDDAEDEPGIERDTEGEEAC
jgi:hypothetical protein